MSIVTVSGYMTECNTVGFHMFQKLYIALSINYGSEVKLDGIMYLLMGACGWIGQYLGEFCGVNDAFLALHVRGIF